MEGNVDELREEINKFYSENDFKGLNKYFDNKCADFQLQSGVTQAEYVYILNEAGSFYRDSGQFKKSVRAFENLLKYMEDMELSQTIEYATVLNNLAGTNRMMGNYERARELFFECIDLYEKIGRDDSFEYASALNNIALLYLVQKDYKNAEQYQLRALKHKATGEGLTKAVSISNLANIYAAQGDIDKALKTIETTHDILKKVEDKETSRYVSVINTEACLLMQKKEYNKACVLFDQVLDVLRRASPMSQDYAAVCKTAAGAYLGRGDIKKAIALQEEALKIDERIFGADSSAAVQDKVLVDGYRKREAQE